MLVTKAFLYITTNLVNGKKYIGQTTSTRPSYLGSGRIIMDAIKKYGRINFVRENVFEGEWEAVDLLEALYIEKFDAVYSSNYYNLKEGGHHGKHNNPETSKLMSEKATGRKATEQAKKARSDRMKGSGNHFFEKKHTTESINKVKAARATQIITAKSNEKRSTTLSGLIRPTYVCPYCSKVGRGGTMKRYHFENCKEK